MTARLSLILCGLALVVSAAGISVAQDPLRVDVNLVNVFLTVQNQSGQFVSGLSRGDFRVYEDDVEQKIDIFEQADQVESAIGILLDNSGSMVDVLPKTKSGIVDFAKSFKRFDELFVMTFGTRVRILHDVGEPLQNLESRLKLLEARGTSVLFDALLEGL